jgi:hypothetical protein
MDSLYDHTAFISFDFIDRNRMTNEAFARVKIDQQLRSMGWEVEDGQSVNYEQGLSDGKQADYVLNDRDGRPLAVIGAKRFSENKPLETACEQARHYAEQLGVDFIFLANGKEAKFWDYKNEAYPHDIKTVFDQENLERRAASRKVRTDIMTVETDRRIAGGDPDKLGRAALWEGQIDRCIHQNHVFKVRSNRDKLVPEYLRSLAGSAYGRAYFLRVSKQTTGIASINKTQLSAFPVIIPPLELQKKFKTKLDIIREVESRTLQALKQQETLFQSLLHHAFQGTLTATAMQEKAA